LLDASVDLRQVDAVLGAPVTLVIERPDGGGKVVVDRGISLRGCVPPSRSRLI
jgi:hypothetical protein